MHEQVYNTEIWSNIADSYPAIDAHWIQVKWRSQDTENPVQVTKDDECPLKTKWSVDSTHRDQRIESMRCSFIISHEKTVRKCCFRWRWKEPKSGVIFIWLVQLISSSDEWHKDRCPSEWAGWDGFECLIDDFRYSYSFFPRSKGGSYEINDYVFVTGSKEDYRQGY